MSGPFPATSGRHGEGQRGSATLWTVAGIAVALLLATVVLLVGAATVARHRASASADLGALAAAAYAPAGERFACGKARWVAERMHTVLRSCRLDGWDALVEISARVPGMPAGLGVTGAHARAGPVRR